MKKITVIILIFLLVLGIIGAAGFFYFKTKMASRPVTTQEEIRAYTDKIGKFMILPEEDPALATVADREKLDQSFFAKAQDGDKVLLFTKAQRAILYRPAENKIIEIMLIGASREVLDPSIGEEEAASPTDSDDSKTQEQATVLQAAVYNGTNKKGLAKAIGEKVADLDGIVLSGTANAKGTYSKTIIIDLTGKNAEAIQKIIGTIGGEAGAFPDDETKPDADVLIIGGSDFNKN